jgi:hypothetical protein
VALKDKEQQRDVEREVGELEVRLDRLRQLYDQYFLGFEKLVPDVARKDVERRVEVLRREQIRNTALRFRFTVITQKLNTYQSYWYRTCRQIEEGTFKRHVQKALKKFGPNAGKKRDDIELDIDVDLDELEAQVADDMAEVSDEGDGNRLSDEDRRILEEVEAELRGEKKKPASERPAMKAPARGQLPQPVVRKHIEVEEDDEDEDLPTNRPPAGVDIPDVAIPKQASLPSMNGGGSQRRIPVAAAADSSLDGTPPIAPAPAGPRPAIRKTGDPTKPLQRIVPGKMGPVMPNVPAAPAPPPPQQPPPAATSQSRIALPIPGKAARAGQAPVNNVPKAAVPPRTVARPPGKRNTQPPKKGSIRPRANSKPPPPLPSSMSQRPRAPSLTDLMDATKNDKEQKK